MAQDDPRVRRLRQWWQSRRARRGRILAVKLGYNPNSSSLGVDVTFLLFGMAAIAVTNVAAEGGNFDELAFG